MVDRVTYRRESEKHRRVWLAMAALMVVLSPLVAIGPVPFLVVVVSFSAAAFGFRAGVGYAASYH